MIVLHLQSVVLFDIGGGGVCGSDCWFEGISSVWITTRIWTTTTSHARKDGPAKPHRRPLYRRDWRQSTGRQLRNVSLRRGRWGGGGGGSSTRMKRSCVCMRWTCWDITNWRSREAPGHLCGHSTIFKVPLTFSAEMSTFAVVYSVAISDILACFLRE